DEVADVVDVFGFQAVGRTNGQLEVVDRTQQHRVDLRSATGGSFVRIAHAFQSGEHGDLVHQNASRLAHSFFGRDNTVGFDVENQFVQVGTLLNTSAFDGIADTTHWAERSVEHDAADGLRTIVGQGANVAGHV